MSTTTFSQAGPNRVATIDVMARLRDARYWSVAHLGNLMNWVRDLVRRLCAKFKVVARWLRPGTDTSQTAADSADDVSRQPAGATEGSVEPTPSADPKFPGTVVVGSHREAANDGETMLEFAGLPQNVSAAIGEFSQQIECILREPFVFDNDCRDLATVQSRVIQQVDKAECMRLAYVVALQEAERIDSLLKTVDDSDPETSSQRLAVLEQGRDDCLTTAQVIARRYEGFARSAQMLAAAVTDPADRLQMCVRLHESLAVSAKRLEGVEQPLGDVARGAGFKPLSQLEALLQIPAGAYLAANDEQSMEQPRS